MCGIYSLHTKVAMTVQFKPNVSYSVVWIYYIENTLVEDRLSQSATEDHMLELLH